MRGLATDSGLHLGLTKQQAIAILGLATRYSQNVRQHTETLIYSLETKKRTDRRSLHDGGKRRKKNTTAESSSTTTHFIPSKSIYLQGL